MTLQLCRGIFIDCGGLGGRLQERLEREVYKGENSAPDIFGALLICASV